MRFLATSLLALPLLAAAAQQESPIDQAKAQAQLYWDKISSYFPTVPDPNKLQPVEEVHTADSQAGGKTLNTLTLDNWEHTIRSSVNPESPTPEEWWVLFTGRNKTCFGHCGGLEAAFNESAILFAEDPTAPHLAYINCDDQPVLCNTWTAGPPNLWVLHVPNPPAPVDVRILRLNTTTTTVKTFMDLHALQTWKEQTLYEGFFHPFDGPLAKYGLALPLAYILWVFAIVPNWVFMIGVSFLSRSLMSSRMYPQPGRPGTRPPGAAAPAPAAGVARVRVGAPPGDGVRY